MSFWGKIFGTDKAIGGLVEGVSKGLDALVYTDEERAGDAARDRAEARAMVVQWMAATQGQNLARRLIALMVTGVWIGQYLTSMGLNVAAAWVDDSRSLIASAAIINNSAQQMNAAAMLVLGFYFAAPHMGSIAKAAMAKFSSAPPNPMDAKKTAG